MLSFKCEVTEYFLPVSQISSYKNILGSEMDQGPYEPHIVLVNGCRSSILNILFSRV